MYLFLCLTLHLFRAHRAHHQERQIVSIQPRVAVTLCRWPCRVQVGSEHRRGCFGGVTAATPPIPIKLELIASVGFIRKESVTMHGHTIVKKTL